MNPNNPNSRELDKEETPANFTGRHQQSPYRFSQEEIRVLKECNRESFFKRCLPISGIFGFGTYYAVQSGFLKPNPRFGATPKVITAAIVGYFIGKFSYQSKCAEKLMQLPNSQIGEILRQRRRGNLQESLESGFGPSMSLAPFGNINPSDTYSDLGEQSGIDIDTSRTPQYDGLDDSQRPSVDNPIYEEEMPPVQKHVTTYEELRKKNREEYQQKRVGNFKEPVKTPSPPPVRPPSAQEERDTFDIMPSRRNKYGDAME